MSKSAVLRLLQPLSPADELAGASDAFFDRCDGKCLSDGTKRFYRDKLLCFTRYLERENVAEPLSGLTARHIRHFIKTEAARTSLATAKQCFVTLRAFFSFLVKDGRLESSPVKDMEAPKVPIRVIAPLTEEQVMKLLQTCGNDFYGARDKAIMLMLLDCGLRAAELCGLSLDNCDLAGGLLLVMGKGRKEREVPIGATARLAVKEYLRRRAGVESNALFVSHYGEGLTYSGLAQLLRRRAKAAGLPLRIAHPHVWRHTAALFYLRAGGDALALQRLLGHASLDMTRRYVDLTREDLAEKHKLFSPADHLPADKPEKGRKRLK